MQVGDAPLLSAHSSVHEGRAACAFAAWLRGRRWERLHALQARLTEELEGWRAKQAGAAACPPGQTDRFRPRRGGPLVHKVADARIDLTRALSEKVRHAYKYGRDG